MSKIKDFQKRFITDKYTGFSSGANTQGDRLLNKDGTFNVERKGLNFIQTFSPFHQLITMSWFHFNLIIISVFIVLNLFFSLIYYILGIDGLQGFVHHTPIGNFIELFTFSAQTLTTVGYGRINPVSYATSLVAAFEALLGLMSFALVTGLLYGRFSRPHAKLLYSKTALISPFQDKTAFMIRISNARKNQLVECEAVLTMSYHEKETGKRLFINLELEYKKINSLPLSWTIVHPINIESPIYGMTQTEILEMNAEFILMFKGFDDTYSQMVYTRHSYLAHEMVWGAKFVPMFKRSESGNSTFLEMGKISEYIQADLPVIVEG